MDVSDARLVKSHVGSVHHALYFHFLISPSTPSQWHMADAVFNQHSCWVIGELLILGSERHAQ
jgi:hypothetical protein